MALADTTSRTPPRASRPGPRSSAPAAPVEAPPRPRLEALDGLRGLASLGVLILHVWMFNHGDAGRPAKGFGDLVVGELRLGVQLFFVLSGFLLFRPFVGAILDGCRRPALGRYAVRRAARILPPYVAAVAGSFFLLRHLDHPMQIGLGQVPIFLVFAQNHFEQTIKHLDPPMWTLAVEVSFYVALPAVALLAARLGPGRVRQLVVPAALIAAGLAFVAVAAVRHWPVTLSTSLLLHLAEFGAGMAIATLLHRRGLRRPVALALAVAGVALVVANSWWHANAVGPQQTREVIGDAPGILGLALVVAAAAAGSWRATLLSRGPVRWLGTLSYGIYLVHFPVIVWLRGTERWPESLASQLMVVTAVSLALAAASWFLLERPAIRWARRATTRARARGERDATHVPARPAPAARHRQPTGELRVLRPQPAER
jgi:peptidoglycan/LPS O-acetylase OafA/YrhL